MALDVLYGVIYCSPVQWMLVCSLYIHDCLCKLDPALTLVLRQGYEVSVKELDSLLPLLVDKKRKMEQQEVETNLQIMHDFLYCLKKQKLEELNEVFEHGVS